jgi:hypothetical protein
MYVRASFNCIIEHHLKLYILLDEFESLQISYKYMA